MARKALVCILVAAAFGFCPIKELRAQTDKAYDAAKSDLDKQLKATKLDDRRKAIRALRATNDPRAAKDLRAALHRVTKQINENQKKLEPMLEQRAEIAADLDKRIGNQKTIAVGTVKPLLDKRDELQKKIDPLEEALRTDDATKDSILAAIGDLITSLDGAAQDAETSELLGLFAKMKKLEERQTYLEILSFVRTPKSVSGLVGIALGEPDKAIRVLALTALTRLGDRSAAPAVTAGLSDDHWVVRAAAVQAAEDIGLLDAIPIMVERLEKEDGRLNDDLQRALRSLGGVTFHDNTTLWKQWWTAEEKKLRDIMKLFDAADEASRNEAARQAATAGFLLGVREALHQRGVSLAAIRDQEARRTTSAEESAPNEGELIAMAETPAGELETFYQMIADAISSRPDDIRSVAIDRLIIAPFSRSQDAVKRLTILNILGRTKGKDAARNLIAFVLGSDQSTPRGLAEKICAIRGLGRNSGEDAQKVLGEVLTKSTPKPEIIGAVARALSDLGTKEAVRTLMLALDEVESNISKEKYADLKTAIVAELKRATGADAGQGYKDWNAWWQTKKDSFKTAKDEAIAKGNDQSQVDEKRSTSFYGITTNSKRLVYVLDISGSMNEPAEYGGTVHTKIKVAKEEMERSINALPEDALFNIVLFSTNVKAWKPKLVPANAATKKEAREMIAAIEANGATNAYDSLAKAFELAGRGSFDRGYEVLVDTFYFLSDGQPNQGLYTNPNDILHHILDLNATRKIQIHTIGVGKDQNGSFMAALAQRTGGKYVAK